MPIVNPKIERVDNTPSMKTWDELTRAEIDARLHTSMADVAASRVISQEQLDAKMREIFSR